MKPHTLILLLFAGMLCLGTSCGDDEDVSPTITRDDFLGTYSVVETSTRINDTYTYTATITAGTGSNQIIINNLSQLNDDVMATVNSSNLTIPRQTIDFVDYSGDGTLANNKITLDYENLIFSRDTLSAVFTRQ